MRILKVLLLAAVSSTLMARLATADDHIISLICEHTKTEIEDYAHPKKSIIRDREDTHFFYLSIDSDKPFYSGFNPKRISRFTKESNAFANSFRGGKTAVEIFSVDDNYIRYVFNTVGESKNFIDFLEADRKSGALSVSAFILASTNRRFPDFTFSRPAEVALWLAQLDYLKEDEARSFNYSHQCSRDDQTQKF